MLQTLTKLWWLWLILAPTLITLGVVLCRNAHQACDDIMAEFFWGFRIPVMLCWVAVLWIGRALIMAGCLAAIAFLVALGAIVHG